SITLNGLTANTTYTVTYFRNGAPVTATITSNASGTIVITGLSTGNYTSVVVTAAGGCGSAAVGPFVLPANQAPPVVISPVTLCQFQVAAPLTATGSNLIWYSTPTGGVGSTTAPVPNTQTPGTYHFYVSQTVSGCESGRTEIAVIVNPKPAPPTVISPLG